MAIVVVQTFDVRILDAIAGSLADQADLFVNDHIPAVTDVLGDYIGSGFGGGGVQNITWGPAFVNAMGKGQINGASLTWVSNGAGLPETVYGVFVVNSTLGELSYAIRFVTPIEVNAAGIAIFYQPVLTSVTE